MSRKTAAVFSVVTCLLSLTFFSTSGQQSKKSEWKLIWQDEFNAIDGSRIDGTKWTAEIGGHGWGNKELQFYTKRIENAVVFEGSLNIKALQEEFGLGEIRRKYTSARIITKNK